MTEKAFRKSLAFAGLFNYRQANYKFKIEKNSDNIFNIKMTIEEEF